MIHMIFLLVVERPAMEFVWAQIMLKDAVAAVLGLET